MMSRPALTITLLTLGVIAAAAANVLVPAVIGAVILLALGTFARWAFLPSHHLPRHRSRHLRLRVRLRLHPGPGFATKAELWHKWGRFASWRESRRTRPTLTCFQRLRASSHSLMIGTAHHLHRLRVSVQETMLLLGPPRFFKSALLAHLALQATGRPVVLLSSKPDLFALTAAVRAKQGPVYLFDPQGIATAALARCRVPVIPVRWCPIQAGCIEPATAIRIGESFAGAVSTGGVEDGVFWRAKTADAIRGVLHAGALGRTNLREAARWAGGDDLTVALNILLSADLEDWADQLHNDLAGPAEKTTSTTQMLISRAFGALKDPAIARSLLPGPGEQFDIDTFLGANGEPPGTLYMIARGTGDDCVLAPVFASLVTECHWHARQLGVNSPGERLDPPALILADEIASICPVDLPGLMSDSGGLGIQIVAAAHGIAQLRRRWGADGAQSILDTTNVSVFMPGIKDPDTLQHVSRLCDQACYTEHGADKPGRHDVMTPGMVRAMPKAFGLALRSNLSPVIFRVAAGWRHPAYRKAARDLRRQERRADRRPLPEQIPAEPAIVAPPAAAVSPPELTGTLVLRPAPRRSERDLSTATDTARTASTPGARSDRPGRCPVPARLTTAAPRRCCCSWPASASAWTRSRTSCSTSRTRPATGRSPRRSGGCWKETRGPGPSSGSPRGSMPSTAPRTATWPGCCPPAGRTTRSACSSWTGSANCTASCTCEPAARCRPSPGRPSGTSGSCPRRLS